MDFAATIQYSDVIEREGCFVAWYNDNGVYSGLGPASSVLSWRLKFYS